MQTRRARRVDIPLRPFIIQPNQGYATTPFGDVYNPPPYGGAVFPHQQNPGPLGMPVLAGPQGSYVPLAGEDHYDAYSQPPGQTSGIIQGPTR